MQLLRHHIFHKIYLTQTKKTILINTSVHFHQKDTKILPPTLNCRQNMYRFGPARMLLWRCVTASHKPLVRRVSWDCSTPLIRPRIPSCLHFPQTGSHSVANEWYEPPRERKSKKKVEWEKNIDSCDFVNFVVLKFWSFFGSLYGS